MSDGSQAAVRKKGGRPHGVRDKNPEASRVRRREAYLRARSCRLETEYFQGETERQRKINEARAVADAKNIPLPGVLPDKPEVQSLSPGDVKAAAVEVPSKPMTLGEILEDVPVAVENKTTPISSSSGGAAGSAASNLPPPGQKMDAPLVASVAGVCVECFLAGLIHVARWFNREYAPMEREEVALRRAGARYVETLFLRPAAMMGVALTAVVARWGLIFFKPESSVISSPPSAKDDVPLVQVESPEDALRRFYEAKKT